MPYKIGERMKTQGGMGSLDGLKYVPTPPSEECSLVVTGLAWFIHEEPREKHLGTRMNADERGSDSPWRGGKSPGLSA